METLRFLMVSTFYPPYHLGGDAVHVQYLSEALAAQGHEVHVEYSPAAFRVKRPGATPPKDTPSGRVQLHPMTRPGQKTSPVAAYLLGGSRAVRRSHDRIVRDVRPDVVHLHNISLLGLGVQHGAEAAPHLYTAHDYWFRCPRSDLLRNGTFPCETPSCFACMIHSGRVPPLWRGADIGRRFDKVDCVLAPSQFMARLVEPSFRCPVVYIPNFVPDENPDGRIEPASAYYLYVGVLEKHKGLERLAEVAQKMTEDRRFILVGRGSLEGPLQTLAARLPSRVDVRPGVERDTLASLLQHAAAFLMPSIWNENAPLAAIEALSWGVPLLVTSRGGASELVHGGTAGLVIEPTIDGISEGIRTFEDLKDTTPLRRGARQAYETHHRPAPYLNRYLSIVRSLILSRAPVIANHAAEAGSSGGHSSPQEMLVEHGRHDP